MSDGRVVCVDVQLMNVVLATYALCLATTIWAIATEACLETKLTPVLLL